MKQRAALDIERVEVKAWAHPEGESVEALVERLKQRGYSILEIGTCPHNGRAGVLIAQGGDE